MKRVLSLVLAVCMLLALSVNVFAVKSLNDITIITDITEAMSIASATDFGLQSGSFSFDASTNTLTLNNAVLSHTNGSSLFFVNGEDPSIIVAGKGILNGCFTTRMCIISNADLVINGEVSCDWIYNSKIKINSNKTDNGSPALMLYKELKNSTVDIKTKGYGIRLADNNIVIEDSKIIIDAEVCGILDNMMGPPVMSQFAVSFEVDDLTVFDIKAPTPLNNFDINKVSASDTLKTAMQAVIDNTTHPSNQENNTHFVMGTIDNGGTSDDSEEELEDSTPTLDIAVNGQVSTVDYNNETIVISDDSFNLNDYIEESIVEASDSPVLTTLLMTEKETEPTTTNYVTIDYTKSGAPVANTILKKSVVSQIVQSERNLKIATKLPVRCPINEDAVGSMIVSNLKVQDNSIVLGFGEGVATRCQKLATGSEEILAEVKVTYTTNGKTIKTENDTDVMINVPVPCSVKSAKVFYVMNDNMIGQWKCTVQNGYVSFPRYMDGTYIICR